MKTNWREVEIELTPEQEPVWEEAVSKLRGSAALHDYYESPVSGSIKGKASLPCDLDIIIALVALLKDPENPYPKIAGAICHQLVRLQSRESMF